MSSFIYSRMTLIGLLDVYLVVEFIRLRSAHSVFQCQMTEFEQRALMKSLWKEGCLAKNIHERLQAVCGDAAFSISSVYFWVKEFECGRENIFDQPRQGRPSINNLYADGLCVLRDSPFTTVRSISEEVSVSPETVQ
jgi:transposase